jgi:hypothetical protein
MYMRMNPDGSETSGPLDQRLIGASTPGHVIVPSEPTVPRKRRHSLFVIEGEDAANVVFDVLETPARPIPDEELRLIVIEEAAQLKLFLSEEQIEEIMRDSAASRKQLGPRWLRWL